MKRMWEMRGLMCSNINYFLSYICSIKCKEKYDISLHNLSQFVLIYNLQFIVSPTVS